MLNLNSTEKNHLLERFLSYVKIWTTSDSAKADEGFQPSTTRQFDFARVLEAEMKELGLQDVQITKNAYVYGYLPASKGFEDIEPYCVLAHMDTVEEVSGENVKPQVHKEYSGEKITLATGDVLDPAADSALAEAAKNKETIITTDGTTLLGADDKAGVAAIMQMLSFLKEHQDVSHGKIEVVFSPDEETGHGMDNVPKELIKSKCAYTVDGGHIGELETECFNAYKSEVLFAGKSKHTGSARPDMVNALTTACAFVSALPRHESPETTDGYQGFYAPMSINGTMENASVTIFLRDFSKEKIEERKSFISDLAKISARGFGAEVQVTHTFQYENMKEGLDKAPLVVKHLTEAYKRAGVTPTFVPIRGGTDGSRLTEMGIPTPNIFTGGHNYHSRTEWCSLEQMQKATEVLINLASVKTEK